MAQALNVPVESISNVQVHDQRLKNTRDAREALKKQYEETLGFPLTSKLFNYVKKQINDQVATLTGKKPRAPRVNKTVAPKAPAVAKAPVATRVKKTVTPVPVEVPATPAEAILSVELALIAIAVAETPAPVEVAREAPCEALIPYLDLELSVINHVVTAGDPFIEGFTFDFGETPADY
jgi:hypothetical protein